MADLGFRPPRFSEESAWLPAWLQQSHEKAQELCSSSQCQFEDVVSAQQSLPKKQSLITGNQNSVASKGFRLFLSGEDSSLLGSTSTPQGEWQFRLHLSTGCNSLDSESQLPFVSHTQHKLLPLAEVESSADLSKKLCQSNEQIHAARIDAPFPTCDQEKVEFARPELSQVNMKCTEYLEQKVHSRKHQSTDIKDAVENSIAASEALVIEELVGAASCSEALPITAVLEAALKTKKARLEGFGDEIENSMMENNEIDFFDDLDDMLMGDAYEDVGLSFTYFINQHALGTDSSLVKDTPSPGNHCWSAAFPQSAEEVSHVSATVEKSDFQLPGLPVQPQGAKQIFHAQFAKHAGKKDSSKLVTAVRLSSNALDSQVASPKLKTKAKEVPKQFLGETSYLSESFDIAPDENSVVQNNEARCNMTSDQIFLSEGQHNHADKDILSSQDMLFPSISSFDPLCSVVPCSVSSLVMNQNDPAAQSENHPSTTSLIMESKGCMQAFGILKGECSATAVQKQSITLEPDVTKDSKHDLPLENELTLCNGPLPVYLENNIGSIKTSDDLNQERSSKDRLTSSCANSKDVEAKRNPTNIKKQASVLVNHKRKLEEPTNSCRTKLQKVKERRLPLILNGQAWQHVKSSRLCIYGSLKKIRFRLAAGQETTVDPVEQGCQKKVPSRKRVCSTLEMEHKNDCTSRQRKFFLRRLSKGKKCGTQSPELKHSLTTDMMQGKGSIFRDTEFLLTGFSRKNEKEIEVLLRKCGGIVLSDIPDPPNSIGRRGQYKFDHLPIVVCSTKLQTTKFLYGCAVKTLILKVEWVLDSVSAGSKVPPEKYMVLADQSYINLTRVKRHISYSNNTSIFHRVGIMLHGKHNFCRKFAKIIQHGGGQVFKTLQALLQSLSGERMSVALIIAEDGNQISRHLRHYASEMEIPVMVCPFSPFGAALNLKPSEFVYFGADNSLDRKELAFRTAPFYYRRQALSSAISNDSRFAAFTSMEPRDLIVGLSPPDHQRSVRTNHSNFRTRNIQVKVPVVKFGNSKEAALSSFNWS